MPTTNTPSKSGFSLIELSLVLVIIGLLIGGVLSGRDLIGNAELRKNIALMESINTGVVTFKIKYGCLPGDCKTASSKVTGAINGDGNGKIENADTIEAVNMWHHLSQAKMVAGNYQAWADSAAYEAVACCTSDSTYYGNLKLSPTTSKNKNINLAYVDSLGDANYNALNGHYFMLADFLNGGAFAPGDIYLGYAYWFDGVAYDFPGFIKGVEAWEIDNKMDDGKPATGKARKMYGAPFNGTDVCGTNTLYDLTNETKGCIFFIKAEGF